MRNCLPQRGLACLLFMCLGGCFFSAPAPEPPAYTPMVAYMISATAGEATTLDDPDFGQGITVTMGENFTSAKGEECRRGSVRTTAHEAEVVVICRQDSGVWRMAPRIWGQRLRP